MVECSQARFLSQLLFNSSRKPQGVSRCLKIGFVWLCMAVWVDVGCVNLFEIDVATQEAEIRIFGHDNRYGDPLQQIDHMNSGRLLAIT